MNQQRPDPNQLLARLQEGQARQRRGKLKIFFGYAAGVGKTYAMLQAAHMEKAAGVDVVVGYVEPHGRVETEALLEGLEAIPPRTISYRGMTLREFDLDAALARKPQLILVDELAHTNAEGSRHVKRWQDVEEVLDAGIDVFTSLNVQHIESLNDVVAQITGVIVHETLPDAMLERADEFELVDLSPDDLIDRLKAGRVYVPQQAQRALQHFFQEGNLTALRELSLLQAANRLKRDVDAARQHRAATSPWGTRERLLVCISPSPTTVKLIRRARRMATAFAAEWIAVAVDSHDQRSRADDKDRISTHLRLAEQLGAETQHLVGSSVADAILEYARVRNVTKILVGKTAQPWWKRVLRRTVVDQLLERSGDIDVYVIRGEAENSRRMIPRPAAHPIVWPEYLRTGLVIGLCAALGAVSHAFHLAEANIVLVFLLGVALVAARYGRGPAIFAAIAAVLTFDFLFVPPYHTFSVNDSQYLITFGVMLIIGLLISTLMARIRAQLETSQQQERRTAALYRLTKQMSEVAGPEFLVLTAGRQLSEIFGGEVVLYLRQPDGTIVLSYGADTSIAHHPINGIVAQWVIEHDQHAGLGTDTLPSATALFVPLLGSQRAMGAIGLRPTQANEPLDPERRRLLETSASLIALSLERDQSVLEASEAERKAETEQLRSSLLSSVSHDLRTPLAAIGGAAASLLNEPHVENRHELLQTIVDESNRLARLIDNLLDMTRLEAGGVRLNKQWHVLEEVVGTALRRLRGQLAAHPVRVHIPADMPLICLDALLMEQVFVNLLENAARYTPSGSEIDIHAEHTDKHVQIRVSDNGPGLPPGTESQVFEKFFRGTSAAPDGRRGVGLGLTICQAIVRAHEGTIHAHNRPTGGAEFVIVLPCKQTPPKVSVEDVAAGGA